MKVLQKEPLRVFKNITIFVKASTLTLSVFACLAMAQKPTFKLSGEIEQGALILGKTSVNNRVFFDNKILPLTPNGDFVFGFSRDDISTHQLEIKNSLGETSIRNLKPQKRQYKIQRINGIPKKIMQPDPKAIAHIKNDNQKIAEARSTKSTIYGFAQGFIAPNPGKITGVYGSQRVFNGVKKRPHFGLDFAANTGDAVVAPADGVVTLFEPSMFYSGGTLLLDHGHGISSSFLHLSKSYVKKGDKVKQGQKIAEVGSSGRATGPHLDWRINWFKVRLDPALALNVKPLTMKNKVKILK